AWGEPTGLTVVQRLGDAVGSAPQTPLRTSELVALSWRRVASPVDPEPDAGPLGGERQRLIALKDTQRSRGSAGEHLARKVTTQPGAGLDRVRQIHRPPVTQRETGPAVRAGSELNALGLEHRHLGSLRQVKAGVGSQIDHVV